MSDILVSICCLTYNHEKFIKYALDGFLMQKTNFKFEILINDDCSQDNTPNILRDNEKRNPGKFNVTYQTENQFSKGVKPLREILFPQVKGKYVALCEGDDYWTDPLKLQKQVNFLETHDEYSICFHKCIMVDENNNEIESVFCHLEGKDYNGEEILEKWSIPTASAMFRSKYLDQVFLRVKNQKYLYGDTPIFLNLLEYGKSRCLVDNMSAYRLHKGGISRSTSDKNKIALYKHYKTLKEDFNGKYRKIMTLHTGRYSYGIGTHFLKKGKLFYGMKFLIISIFYNKSYVIDAISNKLSKLIKK